MLQSKPQKIYFPGLNGLRFISALAVVITHIELMKGKLGYENLWLDPLFHQLGGLGVSFFFVLSGFLITFLLVKEKNQNGYFSIKNFYIRRVFRIWPLYYLIFFLGFFIIPNFSFFEIPFFTHSFSNNYWLNFICYFLLLPNLAFSIFSPVPLIGQSWSIGVEEQFYIFWPILLRRFKKINIKSLVFFFSSIVLFKLVILIICFFLESNFLISLKKFVAMTKFENMIIGAMGAILITEKNNFFLNLIYHPLVLSLSLIGIFALIYVPSDLAHDGMHIINSLFFLVIILNVATNENSFLKLENKFLNFLGSISYGIYMYHFIIIFIVIKMMAYFRIFVSFNFLQNIILYSAIIILTISISFISYHLFEKRFLKLKLKYSNFTSHDA